MQRNRQELQLRAGWSVLTCQVCGFDFEVRRRRGAYPTRCASCVDAPTGVLVGAVPPAPRSAGRAGGALPSRGGDPDVVRAYLQLLDHVNVRLAVEEAASLLRMGRAAAALARLESVPARGR